VQDCIVIIGNPDERLQRGQVMGTTQRISTLCDGDKRSLYQDLGEYNQDTIKELQLKYFIHLYHIGDEEIVNTVGKIMELWEEKKKVIIELWDKIKEALQQPIEPLSKSFMADYRRAWLENRNNYRKLHSLPLKRRPRCRWRQRESRRAMEGLSPQTVTLDTDFEEEGRE